MTNLPFVSGYASQNYLKAEEGILSAKENHADYWYIDASLPGEHPNDWTSERIDHLNSLVSQYQIFPLIHGNFKAPLACDIESLRLASVDYVKSEIDLAKKLDAKLIIHGSVIVEPRLVIKTKQFALTQFVRSVEALLNYAEQQNVTIYLENLSNYTNYFPFHYIFTTVDEVHYLLDKIPEAKIFFDVGHANIGNDPIAFFMSCHQSIAAMSFSNNNGLRDTHSGLLNGDIDYVTLVKKIMAAKWHGMIAFETRARSVANSIQDLNLIYQQSLRLAA